MKVTIYPNVKQTKDGHVVNLSAALKRIVNGTSKDAVEKIRSGKGKKVDLPCVVFAGVIEGERKDENLTTHSGVFCLDFDSCDTVTKISQLKKDPYILAAWVSPSGNGVKALVRCTPSIENHEDLYCAFAERYPELDMTSKNISRLCFESYDPDMYYNPRAKTWERTKTEAQVAQERAERKDRRNVKLLGTAVAMVRSSYDGEKHDSLLKAARLLGGYIAAGRIDEQDAITTLEAEIKQKDIKDFRGAQKTIKDGIEYGKRAPLHEAKKIEKSLEFLRREDGEYDFLADPQEMDEYEEAVINGTLEMGLSTGIPALDEHWMFKKNHLVWVGGISNVGKSFLGWYKCVLAATLHDWKFLMYSKENKDGQVRKKIKEFYIGKSIKLFTRSEKERADKFVDAHFKLFTAKKMHTAEEFLLKCELVYDEGYEFDCVLAEPYNAFDVDIAAPAHQLNTRVLNMMQTFKENYASLWVLDHVNTAAARNRDNDGYISVPWKSDVDMGAMKDNKSDDFFIYHRYTTDPERKWQTEAHVHKIKDTETGGTPTPKDRPVIFIANRDLCGFTCNGVDPVAEYWSRKNGHTPPPKPEQKSESPALNRIGKWQENVEDQCPF